jgi:hypothetical protein
VVITIGSWVLQWPVGPRRVPEKSVRRNSEPADSTAAQIGRTVASRLEKVG